MECQLLAKLFFFFHCYSKSLLARLVAQRRHIQRSICVSVFSCSLVDIAIRCTINVVYGRAWDRI